MSLPARIALSVLLGLTPLVAVAGDWPEWRGPHRDSVSPEAVAPWTGELKPEWTVKFGEGHASPVIANGKVVVMSKDGDAEVLTALDAVTGAKKWEFRYDAPFINRFGNGPRSTPTIADGRVYALGATGKLHTLSLADGKLLWKSDTFTEFAATNLFFGVSTSPLVAGELVLVNVGGPEASIVAFNAADGKVAWKSGTDRASYASPALLTVGESKQAVFVTFRTVTAVNPADGKVLWSSPLKTKNDENAVTPLSVGGLVVVSSVSEGLAGLRPSAMPGGQPEKVWHTRKINCYFSTPVLVGEHLYAVHGAPAQLSCIRAADGKILWTHPQEVGLLKPGVGLLHGTLLAVADNRLLLMSDTGRLTLLAADPAGYKELASAKVAGSTWVHPALANGRLYIKDAEGLKCFVVPK